MLLPALAYAALAWALAAWLGRPRWSGEEVAQALCTALLAAFVLTIVERVPGEGMTPPALTGVRIRGVPLSPAPAARQPTRRGARTASSGRIGAECLGTTAIFLARKAPPAEGDYGGVTAGPWTITPGQVTPFAAGQFYLSRLATAILALSRKCTTWDAPLPWDDKARRFMPRHASAFDERGLR
jgi:hypothetical protein